MPAPVKRPPPPPKKPSAITGTFRNQTFTLLPGDCVAAMPALENDYDIVFGDPPFNIKQPYESYDDWKEWDEYWQFTFDWLTLASSRLRPGGTLCVHVPDQVCQRMFSMLGNKATDWTVGRDGLNLRQRDWIIWHYRFGQANSAATCQSCINSRAHLLVYTKEGGPSTWNPPMVQSDRAAVYGDPRTGESATPGMRVALDVWGIPSDGEFWGRVQGNNKERWDIKHGALFDHPNQLPEVYVARALAAYSNRYDKLLVPFGGSGTECVVGLALDRSVTAIDLSELGCQSIAKRIERGAIRV